MRKTKTITIPGVRSEAQGERDNGKTFLITEMAAGPAERWADRALLILSHSVENSGMAGIAEIGRVLGSLRFSELSPLMDELLACVRIIPDSKRPAFTREIEDNGIEGDDIEEPATRQLLRSEVLNLHVNFSLAAGILNLIAAASQVTTSESTSTSPLPSG